MANELAQLSPVPGSRKSRMRVGRGEGSGKGKTAGRGTKGQGARGGVKPGFEGGQMPLSRRLPKRGFVNPNARRVVEISLATVAENFGEGAVVTSDALVAAGLVRIPRNGFVKVLGGGEVAHALHLRVAASASVAAAVTAAGGSVEQES
jgi:large subunit ribosomal protein L15